MAGGAIRSDGVEDGVRGLCVLAAGEGEGGFDALLSGGGAAGDGMDGVRQHDSYNRVAMVKRFVGCGGCGAVDGDDLRQRGPAGVAEVS